MIYTYGEVIEGDISGRQGRFEYISAALEEIGEISVEAGLQDANAVRGLIHPDDAAAYLAAELESEQTPQLLFPPVPNCDALGPDEMGACPVAAPAPR